MLTQLNPPMPLETPKGKALAHFIIDYGAEHDLMWVTFVDATGECWTWPNHQIRAQKNITMGRNVETLQPIAPLLSGDPALPAPAVPTRRNGAH
jgi:hypothetical protein